MITKIIEYSGIHKEQLAKMIHALYIEDPEGEPMSNEKINATIEHAHNHKESLRIYMICDEDYQVIGYAIIQLIWSNEFGGITANIDEMYIVQSARGQGVATDFVQGLRSLIPQLKRLTLEVTPSNDAALKLYERLGFEVAENRTMEKIL